MRKNLQKCFLLLALVFGFQTVAFSQIPFEGYKWNKVADPNFKIQLEKKPDDYWSIYWKNVESGKEYFENYCKYRYTGSKTNYSDGVHEFTQTSNTNAMRSEMKVEYKGYKSDGIYQMQGYVQFREDTLSGQEICQIWQNIDGSKILIYRTDDADNGTLFLPTAKGRNVILSRKKTNIYKDYNNVNNQWLKVNWIHFRKEKMVYIYLNDELYVQFSHIDPSGEYYFKFGNYGKIIETKASKTTWKNMTFFEASAEICDPPAAPSNLSANLVSATQVNLSWSDNSADETDFIMERSYTDNFADITYSKPAGANTETISNFNLGAGKTYYYRIKAINNCGGASYSNTVVVKTIDVPAAPTNFAATVGSTNQINLTWTDNATNEENYIIHQSTDSLTYRAPMSLAENTVSYTASGLNENTTYYFKLKAVNAAGNSDSIFVIAKTLLSKPIAPSNLVATATSTSQINLSWVDNATNESNFDLEKSDDGINYTFIASPAANSTGYSVSGLNENTIYYFRLKAVNTAGASNAAVASAKTLLSIPAAPSNLVATAISASEINVSWTDNSANEDSFIVERAYTADFPTVAYKRVFAVNTTGYTNINLGANRAYYYRVRAKNDAGISAASNVDGATTFPLIDNIVFEAESAVPSSPMKILSDATASGGKYIVTTGYNSTTAAPATGISTLTFTATGGTYKMWARTIFASGGDNSFWVKVDNGTWQTWNDDAAISTAWKWNVVTPFASIALTAGPHTVSFAYREDNAKLDRLAISNDPAYNAITLKSQTVAAPAIFGFNVITSSSETKIAYTLPQNAFTNIMVYNMQGKALQTLVNENQAAGDYSKTISTAGLPTGIYIVKMVSGSNSASQKFVIK